MCLGLEGKLCSRFFQLRDGEWKDTGQGKEIVKWSVQRDKALGVCE